MLSSKSLTITTPSEREVAITRLFDAPRAQIFKAYTDPTLIPQWWGYKGATTTVDKLDVRPGGEWRYIVRGPKGDEDAFRGVFQEVTPPERLVYSFEYEAMPGHVLIETITLIERDGKTEVTSRSLFDTTEARDGMLQSGMESGARQSWDRLEALLAR